MPAWTQLRVWNDTIISSYFSWVAENYTRFNEEPALCNWFPLRLLVEFAAAHGLRLQLDYWPGAASTSGGERHWNTNMILEHDSNHARFTSKSEFYRRVKSTVTARMIATLNTGPISRADAREGDLFLKKTSSTYWHAGVIVKATPQVLVVQSGDTPPEPPKDRQVTITRGTYGNSPSRWNFSQFDRE